MNDGSNKHRMSRCRLRLRRSVVLPERGSEKMMKRGSMGRYASVSLPSFSTEWCHTARPSPTAARFRRIPSRHGLDIPSVAGMATHSSSTPMGFNDQTWMDDSGLPHSDALRTTERFRRRGLVIWTCRSPLTTSRPESALRRSRPRELTEDPFLRPRSSPPTEDSLHCYFRTPSVTNGQEVDRGNMTSS